MKILVVEDNEVQRKLTIEILKKNMPHFTFLEAEDGKTALEILLKNEIVFSTVDLGLPDIKGLDVIRQARIKGVRTKFIITSGALSNQEIEEIRLQDFKVCWKPIDFNKLIALISA